MSKKVPEIFPEQDDWNNLREGADIFVILYQLTGLRERASLEYVREWITLTIKEREK